jgi:hypothetical protein
MSAIRSPHNNGIRQAIKPRVRGLAQWSPPEKTLALIVQVRAVLDEYADHLPLTPRQIFYRLVGAYFFPKDEKAYSRLGVVLNRARRAGLIPFDAISDDDADIAASTGWNSPLELIKQWRVNATFFRLDRQEGQLRRLLIIVEASGMKPQLETAAYDYGVPVIGPGAFDSLTAKFRLADMLGQRAGLTEILHIGDYDPSGEHLFLSLTADVAALIRDMWLPGTVRFTRLAVTPEQVHDLDLPTAPPNPTDRQSFDGETVQAEAIPPDALQYIVSDAIVDRLDFAAYQRMLDREDHIRTRLTESIEPLINKNWNDEGEVQQ